MRILFLSQRVPYPPNRGDKITTWRLIERMKRRHQVTAIAFAHDDGDLKAARDLEALGVPTIAIPHDDKRAKRAAIPLLLGSKPLTLGVYGSRELQAEVDRRVGEFDLGYAYSSSMGVFLEPHRKLARVMHFAELDSDKWRQYAQRASFPMSWIYRREWKTLLRVERRIATSFDENIFCTPLEQKVFSEQVPGAHSMVLRNGVDLAYFKPAPERTEVGHLVFTGVMDYLPNVDGCTWFVNEILPRLRAKFANAHLSIVGARPTKDVLALGEREGVKVTGFVPETRDWLARAAIAVAPLRIARGIQNKVLEALAMGLPVVGTTSATQGIEGAIGSDYLVADSVDAQVEAIASLLADPKRAHELGRRGRKLVETSYDWETVFAPLDELLERLVE